MLSCTSTSTSVTAPSAGKCQVTAAIQPSSFAHGGGRGALSIAAERDCTWSASADASWVEIAGDRSGQGGAVLDYSVSENRVHSPRVAVITVDSTRLQLSQEAAPCRYDLSPSTGSIDAGGGNLSFGVTTPAGCSWTASSSAEWVSITSGHSGNAAGTVSLRVAENDGSERSATVRVSGESFTVTQAARASSPTPPPPGPAPSPPPPSSGERVDFEGIVLTRSGACPDLVLVVPPWTVVTDRNTDYRRGDCSDVSPGDRVQVRGVTQSSTVVYATRIEIRDEDDD